MRFNSAYLDHWSGLSAHDAEARKSFVSMASRQLKKAAKSIGLTGQEFRLEKSFSGSGSTKLVTRFGSALVMGHGRSDKALILITPGREEEGEDVQMPSSALSDPQSFGLEIVRAAVTQKLAPQSLLPEDFKL